MTARLVSSSCMCHSNDGASLYWANELIVNVFTNTLSVLEWLAFCLYIQTTLQLFVGTLDGHAIQNGLNTPMVWTKELSKISL